MTRLVSWISRLLLGQPDLLANSRQRALRQLLDKSGWRAKGA